MSKSEIVSAELERLLSQKYGHNVTIEKAVSIGGGCIHNAVKLMTNAGIFFLKWNDSAPSDIFLREAECLIELQKTGVQELVFPEVVLVAEITDKPGYLLLNYLQQDIISKQTEISLGRGLARIHQHRGKAFGFHHDNYCGLTLQKNNWEPDWVKFFGYQRLNYLIKKIRERKGFPVSDSVVFDRLISKLYQIIPQKSEPSLIHGDLWSGNYMITNQGPALIDPAASYADREMEFGILTLFGGFGSYFWQGYNEIYSLPVSWKERNPLYQLYHLLNHFLLFGGGYGSQALRIAKYYAG